jgi:hypothetical protein
MCFACLASILIALLLKTLTYGFRKGIVLAIRLTADIIGSGAYECCHFDNLYIPDLKSLHSSKFSKHVERKSR